MTDFEKGRLVKSATHAAYPWAKKAKTKAFDFTDCDTAEQINMCLSCPYKECINCAKFKRSRRTNKVLLMLNSGMKQKDICAQLHINRTTVYRIWKQFAV